MLRHILNANVAAIRQRFGIGAEHCTVSPPGGKPMPFSGQWYISVWSANQSNADDRPEGLEETFTVVVTITFRMAWAPTDRRGEKLTDQPESLYDFADRVKMLLHGNYLVLQDANARLNGAAGETKNGMVEPLVIRSIQYQPRDGTWVYSESETEEHGNDIYTADLTFGGGKQVQYLEVDQ